MSCKYLDCTNLENITIPENVTEINIDAFINSGLKDAYFKTASPQNMKNFSANAFSKDGVRERKWRRSRNNGNDKSIMMKTTIA